MIKRDIPYTGVYYAKENVDMEDIVLSNNKPLAMFLETLCIELGLNTAHDYDGVETDEDIEIYKRAVIREIRDMKDNIILEAIRHGN